MLVSGLICHNSESFVGMMIFVFCGIPMSDLGIIDNLLWMEARVIIT